MDGLNFLEGGPLFWIVILACVYILWRLFFSKGRTSSVEELDRIFSRMGDGYQVIKGATFVADSAMICVDRLIVSPFGVFVVTVVSCKGMLKGRLSDREWILKSGGREEAIHNPLWINRKQVNALGTLLPATKIIPLVVVLNAQIKTEFSKQLVALEGVEKAVVLYRKEVLSTQQQHEVLQVVSPSLK